MKLVEVKAGAVSRESIVVTETVRRPVDDHEAAADAARERLDDAEHAGRCDRRVDRVAAAAEDLDRGLGRELVDARGRAPVTTATVCDVAAGARAQLRPSGRMRPPAGARGTRPAAITGTEETPDAVRTRAPAGRGMIAVAWPVAANIGLILRLARMVMFRSFRTPRGGGHEDITRNLGPGADGNPLRPRRLSASTRAGRPCSGCAAPWRASAA